MIALEKFTEADIERLISWIPSEKFLLQWAGPAYNFPLDATQIKQHLEKSSGDSPSCLIFKAIDGETGYTVGHCELFLDHKNQFATIGRVLVGSTEQRGRG